MNVMNCKSCGRLFNQMGREKLCPACTDKLEEKFQEVKRYLEENPSVSINQLAEATEVSSKQIKEWVREERLCFAEGSLDGIECEKCGTLIRTGRYCDKCRSSITNNLMGAINKPKVQEPVKKEREKERMRFLQ